MNYVIVFAGGVGERMKSREVPKQLLKVHNKEIIIHTLEMFNNHSKIDGIILVFNKDYIDEATKLIKKYELNKVLSVIPGGRTGQESIYQGVEEVSKYANDDDIILVHDGVRPLITYELITDNIDTARIKGNAITSTPSIETILMVESKNHKVVNSIDRKQARYGRAPQSFRYKDLYKAHLEAKKEKKLDFIDTASLMMYYGHSLYYVDCSIENIKITTLQDYYIFKAILDSKEMNQFLIEEIKHEE